MSTTFAATLSHAEIWLLSAPFGALLSLYCWDYGMDLLVPVQPMSTPALATLAALVSAAIVCTVQVLA